uniref:Uncharacterized protein n=1 Tax=Arundo donax TaxID=35708 RepID=A0A0A9B7U0_ARUDO
MCMYLLVPRIWDGMSTHVEHGT